MSKACKSRTYCTEKGKQKWAEGYTAYLSEEAKKRERKRVSISEKLREDVKIKREHRKEFSKQDSVFYDLYEDPDTTHDKPKSDFYKNLADFLNNRESEFVIDEIFKEEDRWKYEFSSDCPGSIKVLKGKDLVMHLRSDQFGFSAPRRVSNYSNTLKNKYPYWRYITQDDAVPPMNKRIETVLNCVWITRGIGGSFLWPIVKKGGNFKSLYNIYRGIRSYIQDRVDLTLLEIKEFYDIFPNSCPCPYCAIGKYNKAHKRNRLLRYADKDMIVEWLSHFKNFETYVRFFMFEDFVDSKYNPLDMTRYNQTRNDTESSNAIVKSGSIKDEKTSQNDLLNCSHRLKSALDFLIENTQKRNEKIERVLKAKTNSDITPKSGNTCSS